MTTISYPPATKGLQTVHEDVSSDEFYMRKAIEVALKGIKNGGDPFGALIVDKNNNILACHHNQVVLSNDPTAHAEVMCIREACKKVNKYALDGCTIYTTCEPCPMCLGSLAWCRVSRIVYGNTREDAANAGFDDNDIYEEIQKTLSLRKIPIVQCLRKETLTTFDSWNDHGGTVRIA